MEETKTLHLHLKRKWWDQIASGEKTVELRRATDYWRKRLIGRHYDEIHLLCGYPRRGDASKLLKRRWRCVAKETVVHEEFGPVPVEVFVIDVSQPVGAPKLSSLMGMFKDDPIDIAGGWDIEEVFVFEYCPCVYESQFAVKSVHRSKAGAYRAMMKHKCDRWYSDRAILDKAQVDQIGWLERWRIRELPIKP